MNDNYYNISVHLKDGTWQRLGWTWADSEAEAIETFKRQNARYLEANPQGLELCDTTCPQRIPQKLDKERL